MAGFSDSIACLTEGKALRSLTRSEDTDHLSLFFKHISIAASVDCRYHDCRQCCGPRGIATFAVSKGVDPLTMPYNDLDVDRELWELLDLAQDDELQAVHDILYGTP